MFLKTSPAGARHAVKLVADANALLSAVIGGRARLVLRHPEIQSVLTTQSTMDEVRQYALVLARKKKLQPDIVLLAVAALPVVVIERTAYARQMSEATRRIGRRDADDVELLALALHLKIPLWSNDRDFEDAAIEVLTTEEALRLLRIID